MSQICKIIRLQLIVTLLFSIPTFASSQEILRVMAWPGYADADLVQEFEKAYNVDVEITLINTDDEMWGRLSAERDVKFDVFAVNVAQLQRYINHGISIPLALDKIPNTAKQLPRFRDVFAIPGLTREDRVFAIPYTYSEMGLIYSRKVFKTPPNSFSLLWDKRYQGRVLMYAGGEHNFSLAALILVMLFRKKVHLRGWSAGLSPAMLIIKHWPKRG